MEIEQCCLCVYNDKMNKGLRVNTPCHRYCFVCSYCWFDLCIICKRNCKNATDFKAMFPNQKALPLCMLCEDKISVFCIIKEINYTVLPYSRVFFLLEGMSEWHNNSNWINFSIPFDLYNQRLMDLTKRRAFKSELISIDQCYQAVQNVDRKELVLIIMKKCVLIAVVFLGLYMIWKLLTIYYMKNQRRIVESFTSMKEWVVGLVPNLHRAKLVVRAFTLYTALAQYVRP